MSVPPSTEITRPRASCVLGIITRGRPTRDGLVVLHATGLRVFVYGMGVFILRVNLGVLELVLCVVDLERTVLERGV